MKHRLLSGILMICLLISFCFGVAISEEAGYRFFSSKVWCSVRCDVIDMTFCATFNTDGHLDGVYDDGAECFGCYAIGPDGTLTVSTDRVSCELTPREDGNYTGTAFEGEGAGACELTMIPEETYQKAMTDAGLDLPYGDEREDVMIFDYPVFIRIKAPDGVALSIHPQWSDTVVTVLPCGTVARIRGESDDGQYLLEADGISGFADQENYEEDFEDLPVGHAKVVRTGKDKGKSVNLRQTPEYIDNVIREIPYGEIVDTFPLVQGEFTFVYYDYNEGWMTTVRLKPVK